MSNAEGPKPAVPPSDQSGKKGRRVGRRTVIKAGVATAAGLALGTTYVKPGVVSVGVQESYAASTVTPPDPPPPSTKDQPSVDIVKTIDTAWADLIESGSLSGSITVTNVGDAETVVIVEYSDIVEQRTKSGWSVVSYTGLTGMPDLPYTISGRGASQTFGYTMTGLVNAENATSVRNTINLNLRYRDKTFWARDSVER